MVPEKIPYPSLEEQLVNSTALDFHDKKNVGKLWILPLKIQGCPDFSMIQADFAYLEEFTNKLKVWMFANFCYNPRISISQQLHAPGFWAIYA